MGDADTKRDLRVIVRRITDKETMTGALSVLLCRTGLSGKLNAEIEGLIKDSTRYYKEA